MKGNSTYIKLTLVLAFMLSFGFFSNRGMAQEDSTLLQNKVKLKALPLAYYTPETRIAFEGFAFASWVANGTERKSNIRLFAVYTQNNQVLITLPWQVYTQNEKSFIDGRLDYRKFPEYYYGLGNNTTESARHLYDFMSFTFENRGYHKVYKDVYLGLNTQFQNLRPMYPESVPLFEDVLGQGIKYGYTFFGVGPTFLWDKRDDILAPANGQYLEVSALLASGNADMQDITFLLSKIDFRKYVQINTITVWASQALVQLTAGDVPFRVWPTLGGAYVHRGYYQGRFRDRHLAVVQSEIRRAITKRFGFVAFASLGRVYGPLSATGMSGLHPAGGGGLRYKFDKKDNTNVRLDYAITPDSKGVYLYFAEAF